MASISPNSESLEVLGEGIYLREPQEFSEPSSNINAPSLVILCTWVGGATLRRINKYVFQYQQIYPGATLIVLTSNVVSVAFLPLSLVRSRLKPACEAIHRILTKADDGNAKPSILLHMFSHGGGGTGCQLAVAMKESEDKGAAFFASLRGVILDCAPGDDSLDKSYGAASVSVPDNVAAQFLSKALLYPAMSVVNGLQNAGVLRSIRDMRAQLNDPNTFGSSPRRLYIYTKDDPMVGWRDVQTHLEEARALGYQVEQVLFEHGAHCGLIMEDPARYWGAVQRFWDGEVIADLALSNPEHSSVRSRL